MSESNGQKSDNRKLAERVYNMIMGKIDTDLLLETIPTLDEKYKGETPEERKARMERYKKSYKKFDTEMQKFMDGVHEKSRKSKRAALQEQEQQAREDEQSELESLELSFQ